MATSIATLQTWLDEAEQACHSLAMGGLKSYKLPTGEEYTKHSLGELRRYIADLKRQINRRGRGRFALARRGVPR